MEYFNKLVLRWFVLTVFTFVATGYCTAQLYKGGAGMATVGYMSAPKLSSSFFPDPFDSISLDSGFHLIGFEGHYLNKQLVLSLSGQVGLFGSDLHNGKFIAPIIWTSHFGVGWEFFRKGHFSVYPSLAVGVCGFSALEYSNRANEREVRTIVPSTQLAIHLDYLITDSSQEGCTRNGILLGGAIGYNSAVWEATWHSRSGEYVGTTDAFQVRGWFFTVSIGGLAFLKEVKD